MRIVFTQFTPPFEHHMSEEEYLAYNDWYSALRRRFAESHEVVLVSLTKRRHLVDIDWHGYKALFFPIKNPEARQRDGRLFYENDELCSWLLNFGADVIHIIGTGSEMGLSILKHVRDPKRFLWERCSVTERKLGWEEVQLCDYYVHPTQRSLETAATRVSRNRLLQVPLGADTTFFRPIEGEKEFDIVTVGRLTPSKQIEQVQRIICSNGYSWIHAGGSVKGKPYSVLDELLSFGKACNVFRRHSTKRSLSGRIVSGRFPHSEMPLVYNRARIMVHPSLAEGAARAVQEALCCEVPVIAFRHAVSFVRPEFGVPISHISELEPMIRGLLDDRKRIRQLGRNGRKWLEAHHSIDHLYGVVTTFHQMNKPAHT